MAKDRVTSDDQRAADVPKVEREQYASSEAAQAAERVDQPAPEGAEERAAELAAPAEPDKEPEVKVQLSDAVEFEGESYRVRARNTNGEPIEAIFDTPKATVTVSATDAYALAASGQVVIKGEAD